MVAFMLKIRNFVVAVVVVVVVVAVFLHVLAIGISNSHVHKLCACDNGNEFSNADHSGDCLSESLMKGTVQKIM